MIQTRLTLASVVLISLAALTPAPARNLPDADPASMGFDPVKLQSIDGIVEKSISGGHVRGAVVIVGRKGSIAYAKPFGDRAVVPEREPMTRDTLFDLASLTKPIATATSIMILRDRGALRLDDTLAKLLPEFDNHGKGAITVEQLLRHRGGLIADNALGDFADGPEKAWERMANLDLRTPPGEKFVYSDVGFMILGHVVERVSGMPLDRFASENIFRPLGMNDTQFPGKGETDEKRLARTAPTEKVDGEYLRGTVHDPRSRALGGVGGHAGLFSTADDLATFADMMLSEGRGPSGQVILQPDSAAAMIDPGSTPPKQRRGLGWDVDTPYSAPRGKGFGPRSFGHTGFTGTSLWLDPESKTFVIVLTSRLHEAGPSTSTNPLRAAVATAAAEAIVRPENPAVPDSAP